MPSAVIGSADRVNKNQSFALKTTTNFNMRTNMSIEGKWGYSRDGEMYSGAFGSKEEAVCAAQKNESSYVGQYHAPSAPEDYIDADDLIEKVLCQDEYCGDWADGCLDANPEQKQELTAAVRKVFADWMDRHGLRPAFGMIDEATVG